jgi:hypothetical protein
MNNLLEISRSFVKKYKTAEWNCSRSRTCHLKTNTWLQTGRIQFRVILFYQSNIVFYFVTDSPFLLPKAVPK